MDGRARGGARAILAGGFDAARGSFTQSLGGTELDASALTIPLVELLPATDPRIVSTVDAVQRELVSNGLVRLYAGADGLPGGEGAFTICSFWMVQALAMIGRPEDAHALFARVTGHPNDLGLLSEEVDPTTGRLLGNFPQAFSHLALIRAALRLTGR